MLDPSLSRKLTFHARHSLKAAGDIAAFCKASVIEPKHVLFAILNEHGSLGSVLLKNMGFTAESFEKICGFAQPLSPENANASEKSKNITPPKSEHIFLAESTRKGITRAYAIAGELAYPYVGSEHLVYALLEADDADIHLLAKSSTMRMQGGKPAFSLVGGPSQFNHLARVFNMPTIGFGFSKSEGSDGSLSETPFLDQYGINLTEDAKQHAERFTGRENELNRTLHILGRRVKNNPLLIGDPGVGKTTLVHALAANMLSGKAGDRFAEARVISIDLALLIAGTNFRGEFEARLKEIIFEATENENIILFIDEIHTIIGAGNAGGSLDAANILKPALARGDIRCIGATTLSEYKKHIEKDPALERRFQPVFIAEPTPPEAVRILSEGSAAYGDFHNASILPEAVSAAVDLSVRFLPDRFLPDKAFDLIDEAASALQQRQPIHPLSQKIRTLEQKRKDVRAQKEKLVRENRFEEALDLHETEKKLAEDIAKHRSRLQKTMEQNRVIVDAGDIASIISAMTRIPLQKILSERHETIAHLEKNLSERIVGQSEAIKKIASSLMRSFAGIGDPKRPLGSFLFLGPSGVGKTLTAKMLSEKLFDSENALIRLDMSEFSERHSLAQILGAPAGYVGFGEGGKLTEQIRKKPYSIVLFDEIEKAHPDVFNILLQILDEGVLTDAEGRKVSFHHTVIILTSNIGTAAFGKTKRIGFHGDRSEHDRDRRSFEVIRAGVLEELKKRLRPELLDRLDHTVVFRPLEKQHFQKIIEKELEELTKRLENLSVTFKFNKSVLEFLTQSVEQNDQGARNIRRYLQNTVEDAVAKHLFRKKNAKTVSLSVVKNTLTIH